MVNVLEHLGRRLDEVTLDGGAGEGGEGGERAEVVHDVAKLVEEGGHLGREGGGAGEEREREGRRERGRGCGAWGRPVVTRALGEVEMNAVKESYSLQPSVSVSQDAKPILIDTATSMYV